MNWLYDSSQRNNEFARVLRFRKSLREKSSLRLKLQFKLTSNKRAIIPYDISRSILFAINISQEFIISEFKEDA